MEDKLIVSGKSSYYLSKAAEMGKEEFFKNFKGKLQHDINELWSEVEQSKFFRNGKDTKVSGKSKANKVSKNVDDDVVSGTGISGADYPLKHD
jgi:N-glycosylase/DNA lyase